MNQQLSHRCDIILPVFNGLVYVKECIRSVIKYTPKETYHLYVVDDCSDKITAKYLDSINKKYKNVTVIRNKTNLGFLKSCNKAIERSNAKYLLLLNSDVVVLENWLGRMLACADSDQKIASVNPLTNHASEINIPIAPGMNFVSMDRAISKLTRGQYPDVVTGVGFCMLLRRSALDDIGTFDEIYENGYCAESDLCMRLTTNGYRTVVADDVYVFHKGSASFDGRDQPYLKNRKIFDSRWQGIYKKQYQAFRKADPLSYLRGAFRAPQRWAPLTSMRETYRKTRDRYKSDNYLGAVKGAVRGVLDLPFYTENHISDTYVNNLTPRKRLTVTYVLHNITVAGGVVSVVQLVNELILLGVEARVVALYQYPETKKWKCYTCPIVFKNKNDLIENCPQSDIVIATHWTTAEWVSEIVSAGKAKTGIYFLQDYESWFYSETDIESRDRVRNTYSMIENKIVKSTWLQSLLQADGFQSKKIWMGVDLGIFYPRDVVRRGNTTILAMARPRTPRRGFKVLIEALSIIKSKVQEVNIILFGDELAHQSIPFDYEDKGIVYDQSKLAELYSMADIFIDASDFQGFGRTALEAMACRTACVLTDVGGVSEYARDEVNCLLVPPKKPQHIMRAVFRLIDDTKLKKQIVDGGADTVKKFSHKVEAKTTLTYFNSILFDY